MRVPSLTSSPPGASVVVVDGTSGSVVEVVVVVTTVGIVVGRGSTGVGWPGSTGSAANVTGTNTSWLRSNVRVWSERLTTAQPTTRQSTPGATWALTPISMRKEPPGPYGMGSPSA